MNDLDARLTESPGNGATTLDDRVRGLRLPDRVDSAAGRQAQSPWLAWVLCLMLAGCTLSLAVRVYSRPPSADPGPAVATPAAGSPSSGSGTGAAPAASVASSGEVVLEYKGFIVPAHTISVSPVEVSGLIKELYVVEDKFFKQGEPLAKLESDRFDADVKESRGLLAAARARLKELRDPYRQEEKDQADAELKEAKATLEKARLEYNRNRALGSSASVKELEESKYAFEGADQRVRKLIAARTLAFTPARVERIAAAEAEVVQLEARLTRAEYFQRNCVIRAPIDGTVLAKKAEVNNYINAAIFTGSTSVCDMADLQDLEVELSIPEREIEKVEVGQRCRIRGADAYTNRTYDGVVVRKKPIADRSKSEVLVYVKVTLPPGEKGGTTLKPNYGAYVSFLAK